MTRLQRQRVIEIFELLTALSDKSSKSDTKARSSDTSQLSSDVLRGLKKAIICLEQQLSRQESQATAATFPPQLPAQMITVPPDGLCLSHACIAAFHSKKWRDEHGETGYRLGEIRSEEQAEERQAGCFRAQVVQLMREYAVFDQARAHYNQRALAIEAGGMPEDIDIPFYAACLNGCIQVEPLGYADWQRTLVIGEGPLRIRVGNLQTQGEDGVSTGHFVLLQSWLPIEENLEKRMPFPFGVGACSTSTVHQSPDSSASASASTPFAEQHQPGDEDGMHVQGSGEVMKDGKSDSKKKRYLSSASFISIKKEQERGCFRATTPQCQ